MPPAMSDDLPDDPRAVVMSRRAVLRAAVVASGGLVVSLQLGWSGSARSQARALSFEPNAFLRIAADGAITLIAPAVEMGQGTRTAIATLLAEELDVGLEGLSVLDAPADEAHYANPAFHIQATGGSTTTLAWYLPLRKAGAAARQMLIAAAAREWRVDPASCRTNNGVVHHDPSNRAASYGELSTRAARQLPPSDPPLKDPRQFKLIGSPLKRLDTADKVSGKAVFGIDVRLPDMKFATLVSSPVFGGKVAHVDDSKALALPGVYQVVVLDDLVAVVGAHYWAAKKGLDSLEIKWSPGPNAGVQQAEVWSNLERDSAGPAVTIKSTGDTRTQLREGEVIERVYELPFLAHATMEPMNCTVQVSADHCDVWVGTQVPAKAQRGAATVLGLRPEQVVINNHLIGGGFGRRLEEDGVVKAVRIAQHVRGPVKVVWSREEDIQKALYRPIYHDRLRAKVRDGKIIAWHHRLTGSSIMSRWLPPSVQGGVDLDAADTLNPPYDIANVLTEYVRSEPPAVPTCFWRGVGPNSNVFARECFLDLIAHRYNMEPVALRRDMLAKAPRALAVVDLAVMKSGWSTPMVPASGARGGRGIALLDGFGSYLAAVAEVSVAGDGTVSVQRVVVAADVGTVINPDTVVAQIQGGVVFGLSAVLHGEITLVNGRVRQSNFHDYRVLRINEMPRVEVHLIRNDEHPGGIGEPGTVVVQPAVANAVFAATGTQLTRMPIGQAHRL